MAIIIVQSRGNVPGYCLPVPNSPFDTYSMIMKKNFFEHFSFAVNTMLHFVSRGCPREIAGGRDLLMSVAAAWSVSSVEVRTSGPTLH